MNIWTQLLSLDGHLLDEVAASPATVAQTQSPTQQNLRDEEAEAARRAIPLWRPAPGIAIR